MGAFTDPACFTSSANADRAVSGLPGQLPRQRTVKGAITCSGVALHSGRTAHLQIAPAPIGHGIVFHRSDLGLDVAARFDNVVDTRLCTVIAEPDQPNARIGTIEHLMAAIAATGLSNLRIEIDGPELPVLDGSAEPFLFLIDCAGIQEQVSFAPMIEVLRPVRVESGEGFAELLPNPMPCFDLDIGIDFAAQAIGQQSLAIRLDEPRFRRDIAPARTFAMSAEIAALREAGLAIGGSLNNAVVVDHDKVLNPGGLRFRDEFVRHKMLDAVGDLALAGGLLKAKLSAHRPGHRINNQLLRALFADPTAWRRYDVEATWPPLSEAA
jgi:UDP-3-O-[3-hydroxymyristoyl] N-acetylglucosamine deacetylase